MKDLKKKLVTSSILTLIAFFLFGYALSLAWFSNNKEIGGKGMKMSIALSPNLVMSAKNGTQGEGEISIHEIEETSSDTISYSWSDTVKKLSPATHDWTMGKETGLIYNTNPDKVNKTTGLVKNGETGGLTYSAVSLDSSNYFIDYIVYIASLGVVYDDFTNFYASIEEIGDATEKKSGYKATTIDFYVEQVSVNNTITATSSNYVGKLNLDDTTAKVDLLNGTGTGSNSTGISSIPINTENSIAILMRCYFDGALTYQDISTTPATTRTYINTDSLSVGNAMVKFKISFELN